MNKARRKDIAEAQAELQEILGSVEALKERVEGIREEEQEYLEAMPESLTYSEKGEAAAAAVAALDEVIDMLDEFITNGADDKFNEAAE